MDVKTTWKGRLSFTGTAGNEFEVPLGASSNVGGDNDGFTPMQLIALGLAGCTGMDVISILLKMRQAITAFEVEVHADRAHEHPKVFTAAEIEYFIKGNQVEEQAVVRAIELSATRYCPAQGMFSQIMPIEIKYHIYEDKVDGEPALIVSGIFRG